MESSPQEEVKGRIKVPWRFPSFARQELELAHMQETLSFSNSNNRKCKTTMPFSIKLAKTNKKGKTQCLQSCREMCTHSWR